jgi:glycosyltransferase involved in cell wall biosynthesis
VTGEGRLRVALDATPLVGRRTGVGEFCVGALSGLAGRSDLATSAFAVSWRRRDRIAGALPDRVASGQRAMPARPLHWAWARGAWPPAEWFVGPTDVVHGTNFVVPPTRRAARVVTVHDLTAVRFPEMCDAPTLRYPALIRRALATGAFVHTPSQFVAAEVVEAFGANPERVRAVHSGIPRRTGVAVPFTVSLPPGTGRYVLSLATAEPRKDLPGLVAAFDELAGDRPDVALVLGGPPGWGEAQLVAALGRARFSDRIVRLGWVDEAAVSGLIGGASVLAYPSIYEGFGFPPLEAMSMGIPVVSTRAGAIPEVLGAGASLVPVRDHVALAAALAQVLDAPERARELSEAGRRRAAEFSWDACAAGLVGVYRDAVDARTRSRAR